MVFLTTHCTRGLALFTVVSQSSQSASATFLQCAFSFDRKSVVLDFNKSASTQRKPSSFSNDSTKVVVLGIDFRWWWKVLGVSWIVQCFPVKSQYAITGHSLYMRLRIFIEQQNTSIINKYWLLLQSLFVNVPTAASTCPQWSLCPLFPAHSAPFVEESCLCVVECPAVTTNVRRI